MNKTTIWKKLDFVITALVFTTGVVVGAVYFFSELAQRI